MKSVVEMSRLISKDTFHEMVIKNLCEQKCNSKTVCNDCIVSAMLDVAYFKTPTVEAVEVVRCKDCKHRFLEIIGGMKVYSCLYRIGTLDLNGYCEMGEKK